MEILEGLFKYHHQFNVVDSTGEVYVDPATKEPIVVYQRIIGDAETNLCMQTALRASGLRRKQLSDPTSLDRLALIPDYSGLDKDTLIGLIILNEIPELRSKAKTEMVFPFPEAPGSDATLEEQEQYQEAVDTYFERYEARLQEKVKELIEVRQLELGGMAKRRLAAVHEEVAINATCREEMMTVYTEMSAYLGTYADENHTKRAFSSFNSFRDASPVLKRQLVEQYVALETHANKLKK